MKKLISILCIASLSACQHTAKTRPEYFIEAPPAEVKIIEKTVKVPTPVVGQLKPVEKKQTLKHKNTGETLDYANSQARQRPKDGRFFNSVTAYDYMNGALYQVYTAPYKATVISFEPGEKISSKPQGGDTTRWGLGYMQSGQGDLLQQHITIRPFRAGLKNTIAIATNKGRVYLLELTSFKNSYMAKVEWNYPGNGFEDSSKWSQYKDNTARREEHPAVAAEMLNFNYKISRRRGKANWHPVRVYDDGNKTFIELPEIVAKMEIPALFIISNEEKNEIGKYRLQGNVMIVDRLFDKAELRSGAKNPKVVRIKKG